MKPKAGSVKRSIEMIIPKIIKKNKFGNKRETFIKNPKTYENIINKFMPIK